MKGVYIIHLNEKLGHAGHYVGYSSNVPRRIEKHIKGNGSAFMTAVAERGISWEVAMVWLGKDWTFEKSIKHRHGSIEQYCPICQKEHGL